MGRLLATTRSTSQLHLCNLPINPQICPPPSNPSAPSHHSSTASSCNASKPRPRPHPASSCESAVKELNEAKVLAVGPGGLDKDGKRVACGVKAGDRVLIPQYGGSPVKVGDEEYSLFRDHDILARINE